MSVSFIISWIVYKSDQCMIVQKYSIFLMYYHWIEHILLYTTYTKEFWNMRRGKVSWRNLLPIRCTCNLSNKICSNHRIIILYNDQHLIILYNHFFYIFTLSIWILKSLYILNKILMDTTFYMIVLLQHVCIQNKTKILHIHNDTFFSCEEYLFYMKITSRKFVLKRNNITIMYPKSNITWII